jgi:hypothetical protein
METRASGTRDSDRIAAAMEQLCTAERARREAIATLRGLGVLRSRGLVADLGEGIAAAFYSVALAPPSTPGYDLETKDGRKVQVRTLRDTPTNHRTSMGVMKEPYDTLLAIRLNADYRPTCAIEVPRSILEQHYPHGTRTSWTMRLETAEGVRRITAKELFKQ